MRFYYLATLFEIGDFIGTCVYLSLCNVHISW